MRYLVVTAAALAIAPWLEPEFTLRLKQLGEPVALLAGACAVTMLATRWPVLRVGLCAFWALMLGLLLAAGAAVEAQGLSAVKLLTLAVETERVAVTAKSPYWTVTARALPMQRHAEGFGPRGRWLLYWSKSVSEGVPPRSGERWQLWVRAKPLPEARNPGLSNRYDLRRAKGFRATGSVRRAQRLPPAVRGVVANVSGWTQAQIFELRQQLRLASSSGILPALLLGERQRLDPAQRALLERTGTGHLFVVSGLHLGIAAAFCGGLGALFGRSWVSLRRRGSAQHAAAVGALLGALSLLLLAGPSIATLRALLMFLLGFLMFRLGRARHSSWACLVAAVLLLLSGPERSLGLGACLSFAAVVSLCLYWQPRFGRQGPLSALLHSQWVLSAGSSMVLTAFGAAVPAFGWLFNLVLVPLVAGALLPLALLGLLLSTVLSKVAFTWLRLLDAAALWLLETLAVLCDDLLRIDLIWLQGGIALLWGMLALLMLFRPLHRWLSTILFLVLVLLPLQRPALPHLPEGTFGITVFDVGQGNAVLIRTATKALLYDAGPRIPGGYDSGQQVLVPALIRSGVRRLESLIISHQDLDHAGGTGAVVRAFPPQRIWHPDRAPPLVAAAGTLAGCRAGEAWRMDGVWFRFLHPPSRSVASRNERSCVLLIEGRSARALLPGDIGQPTELKLLRRLPSPIDLVMVPHHGSAGSSSQPLVRRTRPGISIASAPRFSRYGHPHPAVRQRYEAVGSTFVSTGEYGALRWYSHCPRQLEVLTRAGYRAVRLQRATSGSVPAALRPSGSCRLLFLRPGAAEPAPDDGRGSGADAQKSE